MNEQSESPMSPPYPPPQADEWDFDLSDAPNEDAKAQPLKAAGCSMQVELDQLTVRVNS